MRNERLLWVLGSSVRGWIISSAHSITTDDSSRPPDWTGRSWSLLTRCHLFIRSTVCHIPHWFHESHLPEIVHIHHVTFRMFHNVILVRMVTGCKVFQGTTCILNRVCLFPCWQLIFICKLVYRLGDPDQYNKSKLENNTNITTGYSYPLQSCPTHEDRLHRFPVSMNSSTRIGRQSIIGLLIFARWLDCRNVKWEYNASPPPGIETAILRL